MLSRITRILLPGLLVAAGTGIAPAGAATAAPPDGGGTGPQVTVTLLTGDVVTVNPAVPGCDGVRVRPASPNGAVLRACDPDGHVHIVPASVASQIGTVYDEDLFDVTTLIANGYDDQHSADLPVIVKPAAHAKLAGRSLPSIGAVATRLPKPAGAGASRKIAGAQKVWLDHRVHATPLPAHGRLDANLAQIDAPAAWRAGYTGRGVRVAVLDTGADFTHPDLVGRVAEKADFITEGGDAVDHNGHGTHTATTVGGTGVASHGARRGVAPEASLLVGKVLDDRGSGSDSQVIAGMEWAAARADVVSMSLGDSSQGEDGPLTQAVNDLSKATGALFVIAAGNDGPAPGSVASPGNAAAALTVGAVDEDNVVADFSSRGPLTVAHTAKPDVVAPGVDIVAGRAAGTTLGAPIDANYVTLSGTSMATPHVAGVAALVKQRHPTWTGDRVKAAVVGSAGALAGADTYTVGSGLVDAAKALGGTVSDQPSIALGSTGTEARLTWDAEKAASLRLGVTVVDRTGKTVPTRAVTLSATTVRGTNPGATLKLNRALLGGRTGYFSAIVTACGPGGVTLRTPVTFEVPAPQHTITVKTAAMPDAYPDGDLFAAIRLINEADPAVQGRTVGFTPGDTVTIAGVPDGPYALETLFFSNPLDFESQRVTYLASEVPVTKDVTVTADPAVAKPVLATVDGQATRQDEASLTLARTSPVGLSWGSQIFAYGVDSPRLATGPIALPLTGSLRLYTAFSLVSPTQRPTPFHYDLIRTHAAGMTAGDLYRVTASEHAKLARIVQHTNVMTFPYDVVPAMRRWGFAPDGYPVSHSFNDLLPAERTDYVSPGYLWQDEGQFSQLGQEGWRSYAPGSRTDKEWGREPVHADWYDDPSGAGWTCAGPSTRTSGNIHVDIVNQTEDHDRGDCLAGGSVLFTRTTKLYRDGVLVGSTPRSAADFPVPRAAANYRLTFDLDMSRIQTISTRTSTAWTFRSAGPSGLATAKLPLMSVDYDLALDRDNHPTGGVSTFRVLQTRGLPAQRVTGFTVRASLDDGATWKPVRVTSANGAYRATLPRPPAGGFLSLRVTATGDGGSGIDQTILHAYAG